MTDERKNIFIETVEELFKIVKYNEGKTIDFSIPDEAIEFFEDYKKGKSGNSKAFTEKGIAVLKALREVDDWITAKSLGDNMEVSGRSVSSTMKKLIADGYVEKRAGSPASYRVTESGKTCEFTIEES